MKQISMVGIAAIILLLAAGAGAASAYTLKLDNLNLAKATDSGEIRLTLDTAAPDGIAGYSITFHLSNTDAAMINLVVLPDWADKDFASISGTTNDVTIKVADVTKYIEKTSAPPQGGFYLGSVWVQGVTKGMSSEITVMVNEIDADNGAVILPTVVKGIIDVELPPGSISVSSTGTTGAQIYLDDNPNPVAVTNFVITPVLVGSHKVKVSLAGWLVQPADQTVTVASGQTATAAFSLTRAATISVQVKPDGADISINTAPSGKTPATFTLPTGKYTVTVTKTGCTQWSGTKTLQPPVLTWPIKQTLTCTNEPGQLPGRINVDSNPQGAAIYVDGQYIDGDTPGFIETYDTSPMTHTVYVTLENYVTPDAWTGSVDADGTVNVHFDLVEKQPVPIPEFPTIFVPLVSLLGLTLAVILLKTRKGS